MIGMSKKVRVSTSSGKQVLTPLPNTLRKRCPFMIISKYEGSRKDGSGNTRLNHQARAEAECKVPGSYDKSGFFWPDWKPELIRFPVDPSDLEEEVDDGDESEGLFVAGLDYLRGVLTGQGDLSQVESILNFVAGDDAVAIDFGRQWSAGPGAPVYQYSIKSIAGIQGGINLEPSIGEDGSEGSYEICLDLSGEYFARRTLTDVWATCRFFEHSFGGLKVQRIDSRLDCKEMGVIPTAQMYQALLDGNVAGCRTGEYREKVRLQKGLQTQKTRYFGSRESGKMMRCYVHGEFERMEIEFKRRYAPEFYKKFVECFHEKREELEPQLYKVCAGACVSAFDFRDKQKADSTVLRRGNVKGFDRLSFWQEFLDLVGSYCKIKPEKVVRSVVKTLEWVKRSVVPTLTVLSNVYSKEEFNFILSRLYEQGQERLKTYHLMVEDSIERAKATCKQILIGSPSEIDRRAERVA